MLNKQSRTKPAEGEELGMTNAPFETLNDFRDIESINAYHEYVGNEQIAADDMMRYLRYKSRDNARTPMQWDDSENAGFTTGTPWIMVNPNYTEINAKEQRERKDSVFHYYQKLIKLRKAYEIIVYGKYDLLFPEDKDLYIYTRSLENEKLLVICNFSENSRNFVLSEEWDAEKMSCLIGNYDRKVAEKEMNLQPYEAVVYRM